MGKREANTPKEQSLDTICDGLTKKLKEVQKNEAVPVQIESEVKKTEFVKILPEDVNKSSFLDASLLKMSKQEVSKDKIITPFQPTSTKLEKIEKKVSFYFSPGQSEKGSVYPQNNEENDKDEFFSQDSNTPAKDKKNKVLSPIKIKGNSGENTTTEDFFKGLEFGAKNDNKMVFSSFTSFNDANDSTVDTKKTDNVLETSKSVDKSSEILKEKMDLETSQILSEILEKENSSTVWNLDIHLKAPLSKNFNVRIHKKRKVVDLKNIIRHKLENMEIEKITNLANLNFKVDGKKVALTQKFIELWDVDNIPATKSIDVHFEVKNSANIEKSRIVTTSQIPRLTKYQCLPNQVEFFRM